MSGVQPEKLSTHAAQLRREAAALSTLPPGAFSQLECAAQREVAVQLFGAVSLAARCEAWQSRSAGADLGALLGEVRKEASQAEQTHQRNLAACLAWQAERLDAPGRWYLNCWKPESGKHHTRQERR